MGKRYRFRYDDRLGIRLPELDLEWEMYTEEERASILLEWEMIRGTIPDRVKGFEEQIKEKQERLGTEENFVESCRLNTAIAELASRINDLNLWYRVNQEIDSGRVHN
jgi:hypothetical protein